MWFWIIWKIAYRTQGMRKRELIIVALLGIFSRFLRSFSSLDTIEFVIYMFRMWQWILISRMIVRERNRRVGPTEHGQISAWKMQFSLIFGFGSFWSTFRILIHFLDFDFAQKSNIWKMESKNCLELLRQKQSHLMMIKM